MNKKLLVSICLIAFVSSLWLVYQTSQNEQVKVPRARVSEALSSSADPGFARALVPRLFQFPQDDGPHPQFQTEWWYWTGNLENAEKRHFGYQLTFFRRALRPQSRRSHSQSASPWASQGIYFGHFTISDVHTQSFYDSERFSRGNKALAGVQAAPFAIWLDNWQVKQTAPNQHHLSAQSVAHMTDYRIDLNLSSLKPTALQGQNGLSQKSALKGNASYYYSRSRLDSVGQIKIGKESFQVKGLSWLDREWSTSALDKNQQGWDWFSLQLDDQREIMLYQLRQKDARISEFSSGSLIQANGKVLPLSQKEFQIQVKQHWRSPDTGISYPAAWQVKIPSQGIDLNIEPWQANQELQGSLIYWEGAVKVTGSQTGNGYVELTGYE